MSDLLNNLQQHLPPESNGDTIDPTFIVALLNEHNNIKDKLLAQLRTFEAELQDQEEPIQDPRIEEELTKVINLVVDTIPRVENVEDMRSKIRRDDTRCMRFLDILVYNLRKYRVALHDLEGAMQLDMDVLDVAANVLDSVKEKSVAKDGRKIQFDMMLIARIMFYQCPRLKEMKRRRAQ